VLNPTILDAGTRNEAILRYYDEKQTIFSMKEALCRSEFNYFKCRNKNKDDLALP